jgi:CheY-like chemotaxis protein
MLKKVLIVSPSPGFGELIRQLLEDTGGFAPLFVTDAVQASHLAQKEGLALTILDADLGIQDLPAFVAELRKNAPQTRLVVVPAKENPRDPQLAKLEANAVLPSPFYLPDLLSAIEQLFGPLVAGASPVRRVYGKPTDSLKIPSREPEVEEAPNWLQDVSKAASYLTRLSLESASQGALITRGEKVWAYAGALPELAVGELEIAVAKHAVDGTNKDLARFIHLEATNADYMLYATNLGGEFQLALVFDAQMPFSQMRAHVGKIAKALALAPVEKKDDPILATQSELAESQDIKQRPSMGADQFISSKQHSVGNATMEKENAKPAATTNSSQVSFTRSSIYYSFVILPRLPKHQLAGDLAVRLPEWVAELCLSFGWRLENLFIRPEFLGWSVAASSQVSPNNIVETICRQLSRRVFHQFPRLGEENPSGGFWAPDPLIVSGPLPASAQIIEFIRQTRTRQGVLR